MRLLERVHERYVFPRRVRVLSRLLAELLPAQAHVLDVGCGDASLAHLLTQQRQDLTVEGIDTLLRTRAPVRVTVFDGWTIPYGDRSVDVVTFVDALHHAQDPLILLREAARVARQGIVIKDHVEDGWLAGPTLHFMDWVGNARHGVTLPSRYWSRRRWLEAFEQLGLEVVTWRTDLHLYPWPATLAFDRSLHFLAMLSDDPARSLL